MDHSVVVDTIPALARIVVTCSKLARPLSALERVRKLQEQAAISNHPIARLQATGNLRLSVETFSERNRSSPELIRRCRRIYKGLILAIAQHGRIRQGNRIRNRTGVYGRDHEHIFLQ